MGVVILHQICKTAVAVEGELSYSFSVNIGVHQGAALSPLLLVIGMHVLIEDVRDGSLIELLYSDDLAHWLIVSKDVLRERVSVIAMIDDILIHDSLR